MKSETPTHRGRALATLYAVVAIDLIGFGIVIPILPFYAESFGASATLLGLLLTGYSAMQFFCAPFWGRLSDRAGRRPVMLLTIAGTALSLALLGLAPNLPWLFAARLLGGFFGANVSVASAFITDLTEEHERTRFLGLIGAAFGVGFLLGPAIGGGLVQFGYAAPMAAAAGLAALNFLVATFTLQEPQVHRAVESLGPVGRLAFLRGDQPASRLVRRLCGAYFIFTVAISQLETLFAYYMKDRFHFDASQVAWILVGMALVMVVIQGGGIRWALRWADERRLLGIGALMLFPALAAVPAMPTPALLCVPLLFSAIGRALCHPAMLGLVANAAPEDARGAVLGTFQSAASLGRVVGPAIAGLLYDRFWPLPFWVAAALMLWVLLLARQLQFKAELPSSA